MEKKRVVEGQKRKYKCAFYVLVREGMLVLSSEHTTKLDHTCMTHEKQGQYDGKGRV